VKALGFFQHDKMTIQGFEAIRLIISRRPLQRALQWMLDNNLIFEVGAAATASTRRYRLVRL
jgi:hypothetical protein